MGDFRILKSVATDGLRFGDRAFDARVGAAAGDLAEVTVAQRGAPKVPVPDFAYARHRPDLFNPPTGVRGTGSSPFDDAVRSLVRLGERHGIDGASVGPNPAIPGLMRFKGELSYLGQASVNERIGHEAALRIDEAARRVLSFADAAS